jgi:ABC-2 type transport system permease protein
VVGTGPLVQALERGHTVKIHVRTDAAKAIKRVKDGDEVGALISQGKTAHLYYQQSSTVEGPILRQIVLGTATALELQSAHAEPVVELQASKVEDRGLDYIDYLVPGLLAMAISQSAVFGIAFALVAYRAKGILRRLRLTPLPVGEFAIARVTVALVLSLTQAVILLLVGKLAFGVDIAGNVLSMVPLVLLGSLCFIAIGLLVGSIAKTEDAAAAMANLVTLPMTFLAGVFFPLDSAPGVVRGISKVLPLTYLADGLRGVAVQDHSFVWTFPKLGLLLAFTAAIAAIALRSFRWSAQ